MSPEREQKSAQELLEHRRAGFAYDAVAHVRDHQTLNEKAKQEYATLVKDLSTSILQNGLGQTVAFLMSKAEGKEKSSHGVLLGQLATWLVCDEKKEQDEKKEHKGRNILPNPGPSTPSTERLMRALLYKQGDMCTTRSQWRRAEQEALELAIWLKRFAEALIPKPVLAGEGGDEQGASESESAEETQAQGPEIVR